MIQLMTKRITKKDLKCGFCYTVIGTDYNIVLTDNITDTTVEVYFSDLMDTDVVLTKDLLRILNDALKDKSIIIL